MKLVLFVIGAVSSRLEKHGVNEFRQVNLQMVFATLCS